MTRTAPGPRRSTRTRRLVLGAVALAPVFGLAAAAPAGASGKAPSKHALAKHLLTPADLPHGWEATRASTATETTSSNAGGPGCLRDVKAPRRWTSVSADFRYGHSNVVLDEGLAAGPHAAATWAKFEHIYRACTSFTVTTGDHTIQATLMPVPLATVGTQSAAYQLHFLGGNGSSYDDLMIFRADATIGFLTYGGVGKPTAKKLLVLATDAAHAAR